MDPAETTLVVLNRHLADGSCPSVVVGRSVSWPQTDRS